MDRQHLLAPEKYNLVQEIERYHGEKFALIIQEENGEVERVTYAELIEKSNQIANVFKANDLVKGDIILVTLPRSLDAYITYVGALKAGLVIIPSSELLRAKDLQYRIDHSQAKAVVSIDYLVEEFEQVRSIHSLKRFVVGEEVQGWTSLREAAITQSTQTEQVETLAEDMAFLAYTSGTTGNPKAAIHSHGWGYAHLKTTAKHWLGVQEDDIVWATAAPGWQKWIWSPFLATLGSGATAFVYKGKFEATTFLSLMEQHKINVLCCTPTEYRIMAKVDQLSEYDLHALHSAVSAGEPLNREVIEVFKTTFNIQVRDGYGQTENTLLVGSLVGVEARPGSMGKPTPGNRVDIIDEFGEPVDVGEVGDIAVHKSTPALFKGYLKDPERTAAQFRGDWYITGDRATKDEDGYFWFEGRGDDIIISSGYTIGPFEVEDALVKHPAVQECAVVASPDAIRGSIVKAFVVLKDASKKDSPTIISELQDHVKQLTAPYKYPREIEFLDDLPKTISGKIRRVELRKLGQKV